MYFGGLSTNVKKSGKYLLNQMVYKISSDEFRLIEVINKKITKQRLDKFDT